jgi:hypothetical protein
MGEGRVCSPEPLCSTCDHRRRLWWSESGICSTRSDQTDRDHDRTFGDLMGGG